MGYSTTLVFMQQSSQPNVYPSQARASLHIDDSLMKKIFWIFTLLTMLLVTACGSDNSSSSISETDACGTLGLTAATTPEGSFTTTSANRLSTKALSLDAKIVNGTACKVNNMSPVVALILSSGSTQYLCSGTMISANKVLTAAHCFEGVNTVDVVFGVEDGTLRKVSALNWSSHPNFTRTPFELVNDVAVVNIGRDLPLPSLPIAASTTPSAGEVASIFGYGLSSGSASDAGVLRSGSMLVSGNSETSITAVYQANRSSTCFGDSGGPLLFTVGGRQSVVGVTSTGLRDSSSAECSVNEQELFTRLQSAVVVNYLRSVAPDAIFN